MMLRKRLENDLYACGRAGLPETVYLAGRQWRRICTFKHDFFAATGMYTVNDPAEQAERMVLKMGRMQPFFGVPLGWLGRFLRNREVRLLRQLKDIDQVPQLLGDFGRQGFAYRFIEGLSLDERPIVPNNFFDSLAVLLEKLHQRGICYIDMNKRGNILLGEDGRPYLIDFQISLVLDRPLCRGLCRYFQHEDHYHLLKHKRRFRPDLMTSEQRKLSRRISWPIRLHRLFTVPLRNLRRRLMAFLYRKGVLLCDGGDPRTPENDPSRYLRS